MDSLCSIFLDSFYIKLDNGLSEFFDEVMDEFNVFLVGSYCGFEVGKVVVEGFGFIVIGVRCWYIV